jgi:hypothetical protein
VFVSTHVRYLEDDQKMSTSGLRQVELEEDVSFFSDQSNPSRNQVRHNLIFLYR